MSNTSTTNRDSITQGIEIMLSGVRGIPDHLTLGTHLAEGIAAQLKQPIKRVTLCALGGSAFPGDLMKVITDQLSIPLSVSRSYEVHHGHLTSEDLVIACSFSGNTEESLSSLDDAMARGAQIIIICAGGRLEQLAQEHAFTPHQAHQTYANFSAPRRLWFLYRRSQRAPRRSRIL